MREVVFRKQNKSKWERIEQIFSNVQQASSDQLVNSYIEIINDLSYAQTYFPDSPTAHYLNNFATKLHNSVYANKKEDINRFVHFWKTDLPLVLFKHRKMFAYGMGLFLLFVSIGMLSQIADSDYIRSIIGDYYVDMTEENIANGDPMNVYKDDNKFGMFFHILVNNFQVTLRLIASGIVPIIGPLYFLLYNGVMVGSFLYFFIQNDLFWQSFRTIFIHGTVELTVLAIAGAAGLIISSSLLFPGTYSRLTSFIRGVKEATKIALGLIPFILFAAFMEGYVTRLTQMPDWLSIFIIASSALFMLFYFGLYPHYVNRKINKINESPILAIEDI